ncbi:hypothetical protein BYT27DRAFT_6466354 [Phlegmacium glaucopus]|nr:hypothetical protein BYT27DRAFT_6466354 [Phlegmacium glaucopus]
MVMDMTMRWTGRHLLRRQAYRREDDHTVPPPQRPPFMTSTDRREDDHTMPPPQRPPFMTSTDHRREDDHTVPPPQRPPFMPPSVPPQFPSADGHVYNYDSFNMKHNEINDSFNDNSRSFYHDGHAPSTNQWSRVRPQRKSTNRAGTIPNVEEVDDLQFNSGSFGSGKMNASGQMPFQAKSPQYMADGMRFGPQSSHFQHMNQNKRWTFSGVTMSLFQENELPNMPENSDENDESGDSDSSSSHSSEAGDHISTRMADMSIRDPTPSSTSKDKSHPQTATHFPPAATLSRVQSDPQRPANPQVNPPMGYYPSNPGSYNYAYFQHSYSDPSMAHMWDPATADYFAQSNAAHQASIHRDNDRTKLPPVSTSGFNSPPSSSGGSKYGDYPTRDTSVHRTNISYNMENNTIKNSFNDNSLVDSRGKHLGTKRTKKDGRKYPLFPPRTFSRIQSDSQRPTKSQVNHPTGPPSPSNLSSDNTLHHSYLPLTPYTEPAMDRSGGIVATQVVIAAEGALKYVCDSGKNAEIKTAFLDLKILESEYLVLAGFNEAFIQTGFGYLEEIHIFCCTKIPNPLPLLSRLGKILTPYPGIIFTPSSVYKTPVFKDDGAIWDYGDLSLDRAERHSDILAKGISCSELVPVTSLVQSQSSSSSVTLGRSGGGGNDNHGGAGEDKGNSRSDDHNDDRETNDNSNDNTPDGDPEDAEGSGNGDSSTLPGISFNVQAKLFKGTSDSVPSKFFQELEIKGTLTIQTNPAQLKPRQLSKSHVEFRKLSFQSSESAGLAYEQFHVKVEINANDENTDIDVLQPLKTPAFDHKTTETTANNVTTSRTFGGSLAVMPTFLLTGNRLKKTSSSTAQELKKYRSRITQRDSGGIVSWGFYVDDPIERQTGIAFGGYRALPSVDFRFYGVLDVGPPPPPPERFDVTIASSWSLTPPNTNQSYIVTSGWLSSIKKSKVPLYSNLCQVVKLHLPSDQLEQTFYRSVTVAAVNQSSAKTVHERLALYRVTPTVEFLNSPPTSLESESHSPVQSSSHQH